jgi:protein TonB
MYGAAGRVVPGGARLVMKWLGGCGVALALFGGLGPAAAGDEVVAALDAAKHYRAVGARHLYKAYGERIYKGQLPPLLYAIAIIEVEIDENGRVLSAVVTREPAFAKEVGPWAVGLIHAASPFPKPVTAGRTRFHEVWLVDQSYTFQLHTLTEGQR